MRNSRDDSIQIAIPTFYAGNVFRSRLEARRAAFFDLLGWSWQYEAATLRRDGPKKYHNPDFTLEFPRARLLASVKPLGTLRHLEIFAEKELETVTWEGNWLVLGDRAIYPQSGNVGSQFVGLVSQRIGPAGNEDALDWQPAWIGVCPNPSVSSHFSLQHTVSDYACYYCGFHSGGTMNGFGRFTHPGAILEALWNHTGLIGRYHVRSTRPIKLFDDRLRGPKWDENRHPNWDLV